MAANIESLTLKRVAYRFIPFLMLCYFVNYLDRVNVGFAKLTMDADLGLSDTAFGFGAGIFFLAYFLFEVPSNVIMDRVGARCRILDVEDHFLPPRERKQRRRQVRMITPGP